MLKISSPLHHSGRFLGAALALLATVALTQADAQTPAPSSASAPAGLPAASATPAVHRKKTGTTARAPLDLHTPPLNHIYPSSELRYILAADEPGADSATEVSVKSDKYVRVPGTPGNQLQAIPWAVLHPTQAWRIFTPLEEP